MGYIPDTNVCFQICCVQNQKIKGQNEALINKYLEMGKALKMCLHLFSSHNSAPGWGMFGNQNTAWQTEGS